MFVRLFETEPTGAAILEHLTQIFCRPPVTTGGIDAILKTYERAGSRRVVEYIVARINEAHGVHANPNEHTEGTDR